MTEDAVRIALDTGYRHIDTAFNYRNEGAIGKALTEYIKAGKVKRKELFIVTKVSETFPYVNIFHWQVKKNR